jgi:hypothetical protein
MQNERFMQLIVGRALFHSSSALNEIDIDDIKHADIFRSKIEGSLDQMINDVNKLPQ